MRRDGDAEPSDRERCQHMLEAAREAMQFVYDRSREQFDQDAMLRRAVKDCVQEIGEAGARMTEAGRARVPGLPWDKIVAMRHILVHAYFGIDWDTIWKVANEHLPAMIVELEKVLRDWPERR